MSMLHFRNHALCGTCILRRSTNVHKRYLSILFYYRMFTNTVHILSPCLKQLCRVSSRSTAKVADGAGPVA